MLRILPPAALVATAILACTATAAAPSATSDNLYESIETLCWSWSEFDVAFREYYNSDDALAFAERLGSRSLTIDFTNLMIDTQAVCDIWDGEKD